MLELRLETQRFTLPSAVRNSRASWQERRSIRMCLRRDGCAGQGEATPLQGHSPDTFEDAERQLGRIEPLQLQRALDAAEPSAVLHALSELPVTAPSARFALQTAALELFAEHHALPAHVVLQAAIGWTAAAPGAGADVAPTRLLDITALQTAEGRRHALEGADGGTSFKVKLGWPLHDQLPGLLLWRSVNPRPVALRIDFNRSLPAHDLQRVLAQLAPLEPEFVEEPCHAELLGPPRPVPVPLAFDESLACTDSAAVAHLDAWLASGQIRALVIKPMLHGGLSGLAPWLQRARQHAVQIVVSHLFDGAVAARAYAHWSRAFGTPGVAMGLGAHPGLGLWSASAAAPSALSEAP